MESYIKLRKYVMFIRSYKHEFVSF